MFSVMLHILRKVSKRQNKVGHYPFITTQKSSRNWVTVVTYKQDKKISRLAKTSPDSLADVKTTLIV